MSFTPSPGSVVRLKDGRIAIITQVTPLGDDDRAVVLGGEIKLSHKDVFEIQEILFEAE